MHVANTHQYRIGKENADNNHAVKAFEEKRRDEVKWYLKGFHTLCFQSCHRKRGSRRGKLTEIRL